MLGLDQVDLGGHRPERSHARTLSDERRQGGDRCGPRHRAHGEARDVIWRRAVGEKERVSRDGHQAVTAARRGRSSGGAPPVARPAADVSIELAQGAPGGRGAGAVPRPLAFRGSLQPINSVSRRRQPSANDLRFLRLVATPLCTVVVRCRIRANDLRFSRSVATRGAIRPAAVCMACQRPSLFEVRCDGA